MSKKPQVSAKLETLQWLLVKNGDGQSGAGILVVVWVAWTVHLVDWKVLVHGF
jgi:hypothetical protein